MKKWIAKFVAGELETSSAPSDTTMWTAEVNEDNHRNLFVQLNTARRQSGFSREEAAERLGVDITTLDSAINGGRDLTMMELRLLAASIDAVIEFRVTSACNYGRNSSRLVEPVVELYEKRDLDTGTTTWITQDDHLLTKVKL